MISTSSSRSISPTREVRSSTDGWPSKCAVVKNGSRSSWSNACLSPSEATQMTTTSS
jgi:hypothetical protein